MSSIAQVAAPYRAILCDIWGVVHDGDRILPGVEARLLRWKGEGRTIILVTNAPRSAEAVLAYLDGLGLPRAAYDAITSSSEAGIYDHARMLAGVPPIEAMLAIGDGLPTDMLGAARYGIDAIYVSHGIHAGEPVPDDFASRHGLGGWRPILTVEGLA